LAYRFQWGDECRLSDILYGCSYHVGAINELVIRLNFEKAVSLMPLWLLRPQRKKQSQRVNSNAITS
jgi:hypothetical protein